MYEELPFTYRKTEYPTQPSGDLKRAAGEILCFMESVKYEYVEDPRGKGSFRDNVMSEI